MYGEYEDKELKQLQQIELDVLKDFANVCDELELPYFMVGGSAIGTVRHKGFIPWDDDIDVGMLRKDFERFKKFAVPRLEKNIRSILWKKMECSRCPLCSWEKRERSLLKKLSKISRWILESGSISFLLIPYQMMRKNEKNRFMVHGLE